MKIAILGTRGIPNNYGGFEQCAQYLAEGLVEKGHHVTVYNSHSHPYKEHKWNGVDIVHCFDPESSIGTFGQFIYDLNCILDARKRGFDVILQLGYTSSSLWGWLWPRSAKVTTNMDGLEWKRSKFSAITKKFLLLAERFAVEFSDNLIADSKGIQKYLYEKYQKRSVYIPYGAHLFTPISSTDLSRFGLTPYEYNMLIARLEPENSIETILDGIIKSKSQFPFVVVGDCKTKYGGYIKTKYSGFTNIQFVGSIYDIVTLNHLRNFSNLYFHGHTVGGTNPSLLEAMASNALICAHDNIFNKSILEDNAFYFTSPDDVASLMNSTLLHGRLNEKNQEKIERNRQKIKHEFSWEKIQEEYLTHFYEITGSKVRQLNFNPPAQTFQQSSC